MIELNEIEKSIIKHVANGLTNIEIAEEIYVSERTVNRLLSVLYKKFLVNNKASLAAVSLKFNDQ